MTLRVPDTDEWQLLRVTWPLDKDEPMMRSVASLGAILLQHPLQHTDFTNHSEYRQLSSEYRQLSSEYRRLSSEYRQLSSEYRQLSSEYRQLSSEYRQLSSEYRELSSEYRELRSEFLALSGSARSVERR